MDLAPTPEQEAFRAELRGWLRAELPWEYGVGLPPMFDDLAEEVAFLRGWQGKLAAAGFVGVTWPVEYGGRALTPLHHYIVQEELARARAPELVGRIGVNLVGPTLLAHGTHEQKQRWLPSVLSAEQLFCQLFSEPEAGSDLAALRTRAVRVDGGWELHGQKVWTSYAQFADWGLCLARTDPDARSARASRRSWSTCRPRGSTCGRCARSPTSPTSTRCSSTAPSCPTTAWSVTRTPAGRSRGPPSPTSGGPTPASW
jgi:alkylation response protein AidB-like acyl-CoA dehydrogenase